MWPHVTAWSEGYITLPLDTWLPSAKFESRRSRKKDFGAFLICYMTLCDHVINRLCDFVDNRPALEPAALSSVVATRLVEVEV